MYPAVACCAGKRGKVVASVSPEAGLALLHRHGEECLEHEGRQVTAGVKYVMRSDVIFAWHTTERFTATKR